MKLYSFPASPNSLKVRLALAELDLPYETVNVDLPSGQQKSPDFTAVNPHQKVPVLDDGGFVLRESNAILAYLGRRQPTPLWPLTGSEEALALQWLFFESAQLALPFGTVWWGEKVAPKIGIPGPSGSALDNARQQAARGLDLLEQRLTESRFILRDQLSLVDFSVGPIASILKGTSLDDSARWPMMAAYCAAIQARPTWAAAGGAAPLSFA
jgi:glutathione S-transferase